MTTSDSSNPDKRSQPQLRPVQPGAIVHIREMEIGDLAPVYYLGEQLFTSSTFPMLYRTWDTFEVTHNYDTDPELCLVAEDCAGKVVGFALGTTIEKEGSAWKYGYLAWLGVAPEFQGQRVAEKLLREFEKRVKEEGARILLIDTDADNQRAIRFFQRHGFSQPKSHVWLSKSLTKPEQAALKPIKPVSTARPRRQRQTARAEAPIPTNNVALAAEEDPDRWE